MKLEHLDDTLEHWKRRERATPDKFIHERIKQLEWVKLTVSWERFLKHEFKKEFINEKEIKALFAKYNIE